MTAVRSRPIVRGLGPELCHTAALYKARFGHWPLSLLVVLDGRPVPEVLELEATRIAEEDKRDAEVEARCAAALKRHREEDPACPLCR